MKEKTSLFHYKILQRCRRIHGEVRELNDLHLQSGLTWHSGTASGYHLFDLPLKKERKSIIKFMLNFIKNLFLKRKNLIAMHDIIRQKAHLNLVVL